MNTISKITAKLEEMKGYGPMVDQLRDIIQKQAEALAFYSDEKNFSITVWADETRDGECWLEPAEENNLIEHGPDGVKADFGILSEDSLAETAKLLGVVE
jgi:hypothetical protein